MPYGPIGLLLVLLALAYTFFDAGAGTLYPWIFFLTGLAGALLLCGAGEVLEIFAARWKRARLTARAAGVVESTRLGRGIFNGWALVSLVVSFEDEDGCARRAPVKALVSLVELPRYALGCPVFVHYNADEPRDGVLVEAAPR